MSKDARNGDLDLSPGEREQFDLLVSLLARRAFSKDGPPRETTFAEIEQFGHQAGRMLGRAVDAHLAARHAEHFAGEEPCPTWGTSGLTRRVASVVISTTHFAYSKLWLPDPIEPESVCVDGGSKLRGGLAAQVGPSGPRWPSRVPLGRARPIYGLSRYRPASLLEHMRRTRLIGVA